MSQGSAPSLDIATSNWLIGALILTVGVLLPLAAVARHNKLLFVSRPAKRSA
jgi:hypothetical protein